MQWQTRRNALYIEDGKGRKNFASPLDFMKEKRRGIRRIENQKNRQSSYYLSRGIVNLRAVLLERQSIVRREDSLFRTQEESRVERAALWWVRTFSSSEGFSAFTWRRGLASRPQIIRLHAAHARYRVRHFPSMTWLKSLFARRFLEVGGEVVPSSSSRLPTARRQWRALRRKHRTRTTFYLSLWTI